MKNVPKVGTLVTFKSIDEVLAKYTKDHKAVLFINHDRNGHDGGDVAFLDSTGGTRFSGSIYEELKDRVFEVVEDNGDEDTGRVRLKALDGKPGFCSYNYIRQNRRVLRKHADQIGVTPTISVKEEVPLKFGDDVPDDKIVPGMILKLTQNSDIEILVEKVVRDKINAWVISHNNIYAIGSHHLNFTTSARWLFVARCENFGEQK